MKLYGLIGYPVRHSFSGFMHNAAFSALGIDAEYRLFEVKPAELEDFLLKPDKEVKDINGKKARARDIVGFNITIPHKVRAREILEENFPYEIGKQIQENLYYVKLSGAVNTVRRDSDGLKYWNTDATGFLRSLESDLQFNIVIEKVFIIGCGGAGRAIIAGLSWKECKISKIKIEKIYVYDVDSAAVDSAKRHFGKLPGELQSVLGQKLEFVNQSQIPDVVKQSQLLVNASPVGMKEGDSPAINKDLLHKDLYVYDVVYNRETELIKDAKSYASATQGGEGMLLYQGVDAFELWFPQLRAPVKVMRNALKDVLTKDN